MTTNTRASIGYQNRDALIKDLKLRLGDGIVDIELDRAHYDSAINKALGVFRQLSSASVEESIVFIQTLPGVNDYVLPDEVMEVRRIYRRGIGTNSGGGTNFDPFDVAFNNMYMLQAGQLGGLAVFDAFAQYKETISRIFGGEYNFHWSRHTRTLSIHRNINHGEDVAVAVYNYIPEDLLFQDVYAGSWLSIAALAQCKIILGGARSKFPGGLPGPGGSIQLNGDQLITQGNEEWDKCMEGIKQYEDGGTPLGFIIG